MRIAALFLPLLLLAGQAVASPRGPETGDLAQAGALLALRWDRHARRLLAARAGSLSQAADAAVLLGLTLTLLGTRPSLGT